jgi:hypothetical protein
VEKDCVACGFSSLDELCDDCVGEGGLVGKMDKNNELLPRLIEAHGTYRTVKPFFYLHSISKSDEHNILNLKLVLF